MQPEISQYIAKHPFAKFHPGSHPLTMFFQNDDILKKKRDMIANVVPWHSLLMDDNVVLKCQKCNECLNVHYGGAIMSKVDQSSRR